MTQCEEILKSKFSTYSELPIYFRFLHPLVPIKIAMKSQSRLLRGQCLVEFASKDDLRRALEKNHTYIRGRDVRMGIANEVNGFFKEQ